VAGRDLEHVTGADLKLLAVVHADVHAARNDVANVVDLAAVGADNGFTHSDQRQPG